MIWLCSIIEVVIVEMEVCQNNCLGVDIHSWLGKVMKKKNKYFVKFKKENRWFTPGENVWVFVTFPSSMVTFENGD